MYRLLFNLFLRRIDAEDAHFLARRTSNIMMRPAFVRRLCRRFLVPRDSAIQVEVLGSTFPTPLGVAAGMDKDLDWFDELGLYGFGFVEVGTVTAAPQEGARRPRVSRRTSQHALLNWMGFPNPGAEVAASRLRGRETDILIGANIGKTEGVAGDDIVADYRRTTGVLARQADYVVLNVSSPNTPGLRDVQAVDQLCPLVAAVRAELEEQVAAVPLLIKISPDLSDDDITAICDLSIELAVDGIIATNTTTDLAGVAPSTNGLDDVRGGLSGRPLKARSLEVLRTIYRHVGDRVALISVGGIETPDDAWERVLAGATLVQAHTGFVYGGPLWPSRMNRALARRVRAEGGTCIQDFVGMGMTDRAERTPFATTAVRDATAA